MKIDQEYMLPYLLLGLLYHYTENLQSAEEMLTRARDLILENNPHKEMLNCLITGLLQN